MKTGVYFEYIGFIQSCYPDRFGTPRQSGLVADSTAVIRLLPFVQAEQALQGLQGFSFLWVLFHFHQNKNESYHAKIHPPRLNGKSTGLFATRSPHRPNPIGLSLVEILKIENNEIQVRGIDFIDGTPVLDLKPYLPEIESKPQANCGWTSLVSGQEIEVVWASTHLQVLEKWSQDIGQPHLKSLIEDTLKLDPRPQVYKGFEGQASPYRSQHAVRFYNGDIHFEFVSPEKIQIRQVLLDKMI